MQTIIPFLCLAVTIPTVFGDALGDFRKLQTTIESASTDMLASIPIQNTTTMDTSTNMTTAPPAPATKPFATAQTVQNISWNLGASQANYENDPVAFINGQRMGDLDSAYFTMVNEFLSLAQALVARGRAPHEELNMPVAQAIDGLARGVHAYGLGLTRDDIINDHSTIRTITVENALIDTERAWSYSLAYPISQKIKRAFQA